MQSGGLTTASNERRWQRNKSNLWWGEMLREMWFFAVDDVALLRFANRLLSEYQIYQIISRIYILVSAFYFDELLVFAAQIQTHTWKKNISGCVLLWLAQHLFRFFYSLIPALLRVCANWNRIVSCFLPFIQRGENLFGVFFFRLGCLSSTKLHVAILVRRRLCTGKCLQDIFKSI